MDGLLLDTENLYSEGTQKVLSQFGDKVLLLIARTLVESCESYEHNLILHFLP